MSQKQQPKKSKQTASTAAERQAALDNIPAEDLAKINAHIGSTEGAYKVDHEWLLLAEFAKEYGWQAYLDAKNDRYDDRGNLIVSTAEMLTLIEASRKLRHREMFENAQTVFIGGISAQANKNPMSVFKKLTSIIVKRTKVDE